MKGRIKGSSPTLAATGAVLCFGGGLLAGLVGSLLTASTWILGTEQHAWVRGAGTALLVATIPLLIFAGYCLDWIEPDPTKTLDSDSREGERGSSPVFQTVVATIVLSGFVAAPLEPVGKITIAILTNFL